jgi:hypothetical protein
VPVKGGKVKGKRSGYLGVVVGKRALGLLLKTEN